MTSNNQFYEHLKGAFVAIVTPFRNGKVDEDGLKKLIEFQIQNGTHGIVACGTTGESPTLTEDELKQVIHLTVKTVNNRIPVLAGTGSNSTMKAVKLTQFAKEAGAKGSLSICPYYNKPSQEGLFEHFEYLANECDLPIILYNIPGRTGVNMTPDTIARLAKVENIVGIKEASGSLDQVSQVIAKCPKNFVVLSGDDALTLPIMALGGKGVISTTSNCAPRLMADLVNACLEGNYREAREIHFKLLPLFKALFCDTNPVPVKTALSLMDAITNEIRLPLCVLSQEHVEEVRSALKELNLI